MANQNHGPIRIIHPRQQSPPQFLLEGLRQWKDRARGITREYGSFKERFNGNVLEQVTILGSIEDINDKK